MARASALPSSGSVPAPNSSSKIRLLSSALLRIVFTFDICDEKVDKLCSILCSSPISQKIPLKTEISESSSAGIYRPDIAISVNNPTIFIATVLPPVLGPETSRKL